MGIEDKPNYQVGDKVKCVVDGMPVLTYGIEYIVAYLVHYQSREWMVSVNFINGMPVGDCSPKGDWYHTRFELVSAAESSAISSSTVAVNNHTCSTCQNTRCSRSEKSCWLCGNQL